MDNLKRKVERDFEEIIGKKQLNSNHTSQKRKLNVPVIMAILLFGGFLSLFNETILNVALTNIMNDMKVQATTVQWLATGYMLIVGILVPVTAFLLNTFTTKQLYVGAMGIFLAGTVIAIFAVNFPMLLIARMIQAGGTGMILPIMMSTVLAINPPEKRGSVMGLCMCAVLFGPALGPVVSGVLLEFYSWKSLFIVILPLTVICILLGMLFLENVSEITKPKIDFLSILLSTLGFGGVIYGISRLGENGMQISTVCFMALGLLSVVLFARRQLKLEQPILDLRSFQHPVFTAGVIIVLIMQMVQFSMNILLPMMLQNAMKTSTMTSAFALFPAIIVNGLMTPVAGKIYDKIGGKVIIPLGLFLMAAFIGILSTMNSGSSIMEVTILYCIVGMGIALSMSTTQTTTLNQLKKEHQADGIAISNTAIQIGAAIGSSLFMALMASGESKYIAAVNSPVTDVIQTNGIFYGFKLALTVASGFMFIGFLLAIFMNARKKSITK